MAADTVRPEAVSTAVIEQTDVVDLWGGLTLKTENGSPIGNTSKLASALDWPYCPISSSTCESNTSIFRAATAQMDKTEGTLIV